MNPESNYKQIVEEAKKSSSKVKVESETTNINIKTSESFKRLLRYSLKHKWLLVVGNVSLFITSLSMVALPYLTGEMISAMTDEEKKNNEKLNGLTALFILMTIITCVFTFFRAYAYNLLGERITLTLRNELFQKLIEKDIEFFDQNRSGELISRLSSDISVINKGANDSISMLLKNAIQFLGSLILLWFISWNLTLVLFGVIPPFTILVIYFVRSYKKYAKEYQKAVAESTQIASEALGNMRVVRSFSTEQKESLNFKAATLKAFDVGYKSAILGSSFMSIGIFLGYGVVLAILYYGGNLVINDVLKIGQLTSFVLYTITMTFSLLAVSGTMNTMISAAAVAEKIFSLMDHPMKVKNGTCSVDYVEGEISLRNVTFAYPTKQNVTTLKSINLDIKKGEVVAFVGQSGSGKSTIVSLLERFYDVNDGEILIDGTKIQQYDLTQLHKTIGFVSQEPTLFSGSLKDNITYGVDQFSQEDIENAMKLANAYDFVQNKEIFPDGLETIVGERGVKLSGGQKQRIAIARALIKNPKILIFDEATSALDSESEFQVQTAIDGLVQTGQKTIIIIAHRLSTIINSNKIVVIQNGEIVEQGTHQELIEKAGVYKTLIERQLT